VTEPQGNSYPGKVETPLGDFVRVAREFPKTKFVLAHWGARLPLDSALGVEARACDNLYYDTAASPLTYASEVFREMIGVVGAARVLYGSDHPLNLYPKKSDTPQMGALLAEMRSVGLSETELSAIAEKTAGKILGL
jgi:predicted TIM-barrel fold metal-dependent hydrolase